MVGGPSEGSLNLYITYVPFGGHENERCKEGRSRRMAWHQMTRLSLRPPSDTEWGEDGERPDGRGKPPPLNAENIIMVAQEVARKWNC